MGAYDYFNKMIENNKKETYNGNKYTNSDKVINNNSKDGFIMPSSANTFKYSNKDSRTNEVKKQSYYEAGAERRITNVSAKEINRTEINKNNSYIEENIDYGQKYKSGYPIKEGHQTNIQSSVFRNQNGKTNAEPRTNTNNYKGYSDDGESVTSRRVSSLKDGRYNEGGNGYSRFSNKDISILSTPWKDNRKPRNIIDIAKQDFLSKEEIRDLEDFPNDATRVNYISQVLEKKGTNLNYILKQENAESKINFNVFPSEIREEIKMVSPEIMEGFAEKRYKDMLNERSKEREEARRLFDERIGKANYYSDPMRAGTEIAKKDISSELEKILEVAARSSLDLPNELFKGDKMEYFERYPGHFNDYGNLTRNLSNIGKAWDAISIINALTEDYKNGTGYEETTETLAGISGGAIGAGIGTFFAPGVGGIPEGIIGASLGNELYTNELGDKLMRKNYIYDQGDPYAINAYWLTRRREGENLEKKNK